MRTFQANFVILSYEIIFFSWKKVPNCLNVYMSQVSSMLFSKNLLHRCLALPFFYYFSFFEVKHIKQTNELIYLAFISDKGRLNVFLVHFSRVLLS